jgi:hypothetical protein
MSQGFKAPRALTTNVEVLRSPPAVEVEAGILFLTAWTAAVLDQRTLAERFGVWAARLTTHSAILLHASG